MIFGPGQQHLRWGSFKDKPAAEMLKIVRDEVFPHFRNVGNSGSTFSEYMADAQCLIQKPSLLVSAVGMVDRLPIEESDAKGDLYEYLLSKLTTAGINGQFRTPRHIIRMMVHVIVPEAHRYHRRPGLRHRRVPGRRPGIHLPYQHFEGRHHRARRRRGQQDHDLHGRQAQPRRAPARPGGHVLRVRFRRHRCFALRR